MNRKMIAWIVALITAIMMIVPATMAEEIPADPFEEILAEYAHAKSVEPYQVVVHPPRVTGWGNLRWAPTNHAPMVAAYFAKQELTVLKELPHWMLVESKETGDIGYISKELVAAPGEVQIKKELNPAIEENGKTNLGVIDINGAFSLQCALPEGYTIQPLKSASDQMVAIVSSEDPLKPILRLSVAYDEAYASVERMNDLDDDAFSVLEKTFTDSNPTVEITYGDTGLGTRLMLVYQNDAEIDFLDILSIYKGYFVECVVLPSEKAENFRLSEEQIQVAIDFLTEMDFIPAGEGN